MRRAVPLDGKELELVKLDALSNLGESRSGLIVRSGKDDRKVQQLARNRALFNWEGCRGIE